MTDAQKEVAVFACTIAVITLTSYGVGLVMGRWSAKQMMSKFDQAVDESIAPKKK